MFTLSMGERDNKFINIKGKYMNRFFYILTVLCFTLAAAKADTPNWKREYSLPNGIKVNRSPKGITFDKGKIHYSAGKGMHLNGVDLSMQQDEPTFSKEVSKLARTESQQPKAEPAKKSKRHKVKSKAEEPRKFKKARPAKKTKRVKTKHKKEDSRTLRKTKHAKNAKHVNSRHSTDESKLSTKGRKKASRKLSKEDKKARKAALKKQRKDQKAERKRIAKQKKLNAKKLKSERKLSKKRQSKKYSRKNDRRNRHSRRR